MSNQTLVSIPSKFENFKQIRQFAVRLVEKLDVVLGFRSTTGYETAGTAEAYAATIIDLISQNTLAIDAVVDSVEAVQSSIDDLVAAIDSMRLAVAISDLAYTAPTISAVYNQSQVQGLATNLEAVSDKLDTVMAVLRTAGVLA